MGGRQAVTVIAGLGFRRGVLAEEIAALVREACRRSGRAASILAAPAFKRDDNGLAQAAESLGLRLVSIEADALAAAQAGCPTSSERTQRAVGFGSVAEAAALAAAGPGARLLLPRIASARVTCALAEAPA